MYLRQIKFETIVNAVAQLYGEANVIPLPDLIRTMRAVLQKEKKAITKYIVHQIIENFTIAGKINLPLCQDTGTPTVFIEWGQNVHLDYGTITDAVNEGINQATKKFYLRASLIKDPISRKNTGNNTPALVYTSICKGDRLKITVLAKGAGAENMSRVKMFNPTAKTDDISEFIIETVSNAGANPCPPVIVGVGIGGDFAYAPYLAKKSLLRGLGERNPDKFYAQWERDLIKRINRLGIGPQGTGGKVTALDVFIEPYPCHIASLPVAVNLQCYLTRHKSVVF